MEDIVIIGGGPAGLTAAIYVQRAGKHAVVLEGNAPGGQILTTSSVVNYPAIKFTTGAEYAQNLYEQVLALGAEVRFTKAVGLTIEKDKKVVQTTDGNIEAKAVILATGASNRKLGIEKEVDFLGKGVSYCATCDGAFFKGKNVAVSGGGNAAVEDALYLSNICKKVYLIHRRNELRAEQMLVNELKSKSNVEFVLEANVTKILGNDHVKGIEVLNLNGETKILDVNALFIAIGQVPGNQAFANVATLDNYGYIIAAEDCKTNVPGVYVAGDARVKTVRQLTTACADGTVSAIAAIAYLRTLQ
jgi:thioredoxin reductase (NADPH)